MPRGIRSLRACEIPDGLVRRRRVAGFGSQNTPCGLRMLLGFRTRRRDEKRATVKTDQPVCRARGGAMTPASEASTESRGRFEGTVSLVTGASRGIGFAIAQRIVAEGGSVVITARRQETLDQAVEALGPAASAVAGRADDAEHRAAVFAHIAERHGRL